MVKKCKKKLQKVFKKCENNAGKIVKSAEKSANVKIQFKIKY